MSRARFLPESADVLGADETQLWQGRPLVGSLALRLFHLRGLLGYFGVVAAVNLYLARGAGGRPADAFAALGWVGLAALAVTAIAFAAAWLLAATTRYTLTDKRLILQIGVALPIALTLPLKRVASAGVHVHGDGSGDIPLDLGDSKLAYLLIWPHVRPWRFAAPQPMLRCVPDAAAVAHRLAQALLVASPAGEITLQDAGSSPLRPSAAEPAFV